MRTAYIQGWWPCVVIESANGLVKVLVDGRRLTFEAWLVEDKRRTL